MNRRAKSLILISSFAAFFVLAGFLVSYAQGYKFDVGEFKWVKTGGLTIKANAAGAMIFIDDRSTGKIPFLSNTFTKKNLRPGDYSLRIEKDGALTVLKNIEIESGQVAQLIHVFLPQKQEIESFVNALPEEKPLPYFINARDGLLYEKTNKENKKLSSEPVYIKNFKFKVFGNNFYLASSDTEAPGLFSLNSDGNWDKIFDRPLTDVALSPDGKKLALIDENEINVLWLKDESEAPYFRQGHSELILRISRKIEKAFWFKTDWHLIYLTDSGETHFIDLDPTGGRNDLVI